MIHINKDWYPVKRSVVNISKDMSDWSNLSGESISLLLNFAGFKGTPFQFRSKVKFRLGVLSRFRCLRESKLLYCFVEVGNCDIYSVIRERTRFLFEEHDYYIFAGKHGFLIIDESHLKVEDAQLLSGSTVVGIHNDSVCVYSGSKVHDLKLTNGRLLAKDIPDDIHQQRLATY